MVRKSNFIVEGGCFIPAKINDDLYHRVLSRIDDHFYHKGYDRLVLDSYIYSSPLFQQTYNIHLADYSSRVSKILRGLLLISKDEYEERAYFSALKKLTNDTPARISYSIVPAKKRNVSGCIMNIRVEPAIIFKMKQLYPKMKVDEAEYEDIIDSSEYFISEFIASFGFKTIEKPCATNKYRSSKKNDADLITVSPSCFKIPQTNILPQSVSVMMPFKQEYDSVYKIIKEACSNIGFECYRADDFWNNSIIIQDIFELIYCSTIVIADFSGKNSNVLYEAGIAHTLGKDVISLTQKIEDIPFDLTHHRHIIYKNEGEELKQLRIKLESRLQNIKDKQIIEI